MKLTKFGEIIFFVCVSLIAIESLIALLCLVDHINWVGNHYCFKSMTECYFPTEGK